MSDKREEFIQMLLNQVDLNNKRVLDVGCGVGVISFLINDIFDNVEIVGIDFDENFINMANENKTDNIEFYKSDINDIPSNLGLFDVIIGRWILMYVDNPLKTINYLNKFLKHGGKFIFEESDISGSVLNKNLPLNIEIQNLIWDCVKKEGGNVEIGSELYSLFKENGFKIDYFDSQLNIHTSETGSDLSWVFNVMKPRLIANGIIGEDYVVENLEEKLSDELEKTNSFLIRDLSYGIIASKI